MTYNAQTRAQWWDIVKKIGGAVLKTVMTAEVNGEPAKDMDEAQSQMLEKILRDAVDTK